MKVEKPILIFYLIVLVFCLGCDSKVKNRVQITGGTYRVVTKFKTKKSNVPFIRPATSLDSVLGIGICLNVDFFSDTNLTTGFINTQTQGLDGVKDSIERVSFSNRSKDLTMQMYNVEGVQVFQMNKEHLIEGREYLHDRKNSYYEVFSFTNPIDFTTEYNERGEFVFRNNLEREFFFWFRESSQLSYDSVKNLEIILCFSDGRKVRVPNADASPSEKK